MESDPPTYKRKGLLMDIFITTMTHLCRHILLILFLSHTLLLSNFYPFVTKESNKHDIK